MPKPMDTGLNALFVIAIVSISGFRPTWHAARAVPIRYSNCPKGLELSIASFSHIENICDRPVLQSWKFLRLGFPLVDPRIWTDVQSEYH